MPRTRADLLDSYRSYLALQRDLSGHTVRAYLVDINDLLSFLGVGEGDAEPVDTALATLDLADLRDWLAAMAASGHSRATLARRSASMRSTPAADTETSTCRPSSGCADRSTNPRSTSEAITRVIDGGRTRSRAASAPGVIGPSLNTVASADNCVSDTGESGRRNRS